MELIAGGGLGAGVMPGIGAIVEAGDAFSGMGVGVALLTGEGVAIGMPGMGAIAGCAARPGETFRTVKTATTPTRVKSKRTSR